MAVTQEFNKVTYACDGGTVEFDLATKVFATSEVSVLLKTVATGEVVTLVETTDYTIAAISGNLDNGVRVTTVATYSSVYEITLIREVTETQGLELEVGGDLPAEELEDALDRGVMISQQIDERQGRSLSFPVTDPSGLDYEVESSVARASKALGFDASGNVTSIDLVASGTVGVDTEKGLSMVGNIIAAEVDDTSIEFDAGHKISVKDGGVDTDQIADDVVNSWLRHYDGPGISINTPGTTGLAFSKWYNVTGSGITLELPDGGGDANNRGKTISVRNYGSADVSIINSPETGPIAIPSFPGGTLKPNQWATFVYNAYDPTGEGWWLISKTMYDITAFNADPLSVSALATEIAPRSVIKDYADGTLSAASNGYQLFSSGFMIQWGAIDATPTGAPVTFTPSFNVNAYSITATYIQSVPDGHTPVYVYDKTKTGFKVRTREANLTVNWIAVGY